MIKQNSPRILVSHSGKQYVHRFLQALLSNNRSVLFCSPIWLQNLPGWINRLPIFLRRRLTAEFNKRLFKFQGDISIINCVRLAIMKEVIERIPLLGGVNRAQFDLERKQDEFASQLVKKSKPTLVVGYEISSEQTFREARKNGITTVLDLAQIHYQDIDSIAMQFPAMNYILQNPWYKEINKRKQAEYELADYFITLSSFARQSLVAHGIPEEKIFVTNLGFDVNLFQPKIEYQQREELRLLICGTGLERKGLGLLLSVFEELIVNYKLHLTVIGPSTEISRLSLNDKRNIELYEFMPHEQLVKKYQEADLFVFPSYLDSWAMTVLEAMACGTPVIITENTGSKDAVAKGGGLIIPTGDKNGLMNSILFFDENRNRLAEYGRQARANAFNYTWENYNQQIEDVLKAIDVK